VSSLYKPPSNPIRQ